jgi:hypothetical protein
VTLGGVAANEAAKENSCVELVEARRHVRRRGLALEAGRRAAPTGMARGQSAAACARLEWRRSGRIELDNLIITNLTTTAAGRSPWRQQIGAAVQMPAVGLWTRRHCVESTCVVGRTSKTESAAPHDSQASALWATESFEQQQVRREILIFGCPVFRAPFPARGPSGPRQFMRARSTREWSVNLCKFSTKARTHT